MNTTHDALINELSENGFEIELFSSGAIATRWTNVGKRPVVRVAINHREEEITVFSFDGWQVVWQARFDMNVPAAAIVATAKEAF